MTLFLRPWASCGSTTQKITSSYNANDELTTISDSNATINYTLDALGRATAISNSIAGLTPSVTLNQSFNAAGLRTELKANIGSTLDFKNSYQYDTLGRMTELIQQGQSGGNAVTAKRATIAYNALNQRTLVSRFQSTGSTNAVATTEYSYDTLNRLGGLTHKQGTTTLAGYTYGYDGMSRLTSVTSTIEGLSTFSDDAGSQVVGADHASGGQPDETYSFDANGNRNSSGYTTTSNNRTTAQPGFTYAYDDQGNRTSRTETATGKVTEYSWDHRNRLTTVKDRATSGGSVIKQVDYAYDAFNRLVKRTYDADGAGAGSATTQYWVYDEGINAVMQFDGASSSNLSHRYLWTDTVDELMADEIVGTGADTQYALGDHLGTIRDIANFNESTSVTSVTNHRTYSSFGTLTAESNSAIDLIFGYTGKQLDDVTGLQHNLFRWYDSAIGQWLSEDPLSFAAGDENLKRYVGNKSVNYMDQNGLYGEPQPTIPPITFGGQFLIATPPPPSPIPPLIPIDVELEQQRLALAAISATKFTSRNTVWQQIKEENAAMFAHWQELATEISFWGIPLLIATSESGDLAPFLSNVIDKIEGVTGTNLQIQYSPSYVTTLGTVKIEVNGTFIIKDLSSLIDQWEAEFKDFEAKWKNLIQVGGEIKIEIPYRPSPNQQEIESKMHVPRRIAFLVAITMGLSVAKPAMGQAEFQRGRAFFQNVETDVTEYVRQLRSAISSQTSTEESKSLAICELSMLTDDNSKVVQVLNQEFAKHPTIEIGNLLCRGRLRNKQFLLGKQLCQELLISNPRNSDCQMISALVNKSITKELVEIAKIDSYALLVIAAVHGANADYEPCSQFARKYLNQKKLGPPLQEELPYSLLGKALYKLGNRNQETATALETAVTLSKQLNRPQESDAAQVAAIISACHVSEGHTDEAYNWAKAAYAIDSESYDSNVMLFTAIILQKQNKTLNADVDDELCLKCLKRAHSIKPSFHIASELSKMLWKKESQREALGLLAPYLSEDVDLTIRAIIVGAILSQEDLSAEELKGVGKAVVGLTPRIDELDHEIRCAVIKRLIYNGMFVEAKAAIDRLESCVKDKGDSEEIESLNILLRTKQSP